MALCMVGHGGYAVDSVSKKRCIRPGLKLQDIWELQSKQIEHAEQYRALRDELSNHRNKIKEMTETLSAYSDSNNNMENLANILQSAQNLKEKGETLRLNCLHAEDQVRQDERNDPVYSEEHAALPRTLAYDTLHQSVKDHVERLNEAIQRVENLQQQYPQQQEEDDAETVSTQERLDREREQVVPAVPQRKLLREIATDTGRGLYQRKQ